MITFEDIKKNKEVNTYIQKADEALIALGYAKKEITKVLEKIDTSLDEGALIKKALQMMIK